jgi:hypothetical protein
MKAAEEMKREELPNETPRKDMMREALKYYEELAAIARRHRSDIPEAIRAYYASPPSATAEEIPTAKEFVNKYYNLPQSKVMTVRIGSLIKCLERFAALQSKPQPTAEGAEDDDEIILGEPDKLNLQWSGYGPLGNIQQQPTAEGAEEIQILLKDFYYHMDEWMHIDNADDFDVEINSWVKNNINRFAALHAQKIADKMVDGRLNKWEFISFANHFHRKKERIKRGECPIRPEEIYDEWINLKSRDSHE